MPDWMQTLFSNPQAVSGYWLFIAIILLSYLLEDLAIVTAALLAADNVMSAPFALLAIFIGIASGDIALYGLGMLAARWRGLKYRLLTNRKMRQVRSKLRARPYMNIAVIRFVPGLRTLGFTLSGLFRIGFMPFMLSVLLATAVWTAMIFAAVYQLGLLEWWQDSNWKWLMVPVALLLLHVVNRASNKPSFSSRQKGVSV